MVQPFQGGDPMAEPNKNFWQRHPGVDAYSLFWLVILLVLAGLGRF